MKIPSESGGVVKEVSSLFCGRDMCRVWAQSAVQGTYIVCVKTGLHASLYSTKIAPLIA